MAARGSVFMPARAALAGAALAALPFLTPVASAQTAGSATAEVRTPDGRMVGTATFTPTSGGARITGRFTGLTPGLHGIHVHETGVCEGPAFASAGGHLNPAGRQHGFENPAGAHEGDLPNLEVAANGVGSIDAVVEGATFDTSPTSLLKPGGTALVIHADPDDEMTDPAGNSGTRIACGVVVAGAQAAGAAGRAGGLSPEGVAAALAVLGAGALVLGGLRRRVARLSA